MKNDWVCPVCGTQNAAEDGKCIVCMGAKISPGTVRAERPEERENGTTVPTAEYRQIPAGKDPADEIADRIFADEDLTVGDEDLTVGDEDLTVGEDDLTVVDEDLTDRDEDLTGRTVGRSGRTPRWLRWRWLDRMRRRVRIRGTLRDLEISPALLAVSAIVLVAAWLLLLMQTLSGAAPGEWSFGLAEKVFAGIGENGFTRIGPRLAALADGAAASFPGPLSLADAASPAVLAWERIRSLFGGPGAEQMVTVICSLAMSLGWLAWHIMRAWRTFSWEEPHFWWMPVGVVIGLMDLLLVAAGLFCPWREDWQHTAALINTLLCMRAPAFVLAWLNSQIVRVVISDDDDAKKLHTLQHLIWALAVWALAAAAARVR